MILLFVSTRNAAHSLPAGRQKHLPGTQVPDLAAMLTGYPVSPAHLHQGTSVRDVFRCLLNEVTVLCREYTRHYCLFQCPDWLVASNSRFSHPRNSLFPAFSLSCLQKNFCAFLSPLSVYWLLLGRMWFHCQFNKDSAAPLVTALTLSHCHSPGVRLAAGLGEAMPQKPECPTAKLPSTRDLGGSSAHLGQDQKSPERWNRRPTLSELGSNQLHSTFLPAQLQTLKVSEFPKIMNFTQPPNQLFMFPKKF